MMKDKKSIATFKESTEKHVPDRRAVDRNRVKYCSSRKKSKIRPFVTPLSILLMGFSLSITSYLLNVSIEKNRHQAIFDEEVLHEITPTIVNMIDNNISTLHGIKSFFEASDHVSRQDFTNYVKYELEIKSGIQALEWSPYVRDDERKTYEDNAKKDGLMNFQFTQRQEQGKMITRKNHIDYLPAYYIEPLAGNKATLGFDIASNPKRLAPLNFARDTGKLIITPPIILVQEQGSQSGFLAFLPIYKRNEEVNTAAERRHSLNGFAVGIFRSSDLINSALETLGDKGVHIQIFDVDATDTKESKLIFEHQHIVPITSLTQSILINVANRTWRFEFHAYPRFINKHKTYIHIITFIMGLILTLVISYSLFKIRKKEVLLERVNEELDQLIETANTPIFGIDVKGNINKWNQSAMKISGFSKGEVLGQNLVDNLIIKEYRYAINKVLDDALIGKETANVELPFFNKKGQKIMLLLNTSTRKDNSGNIIGVVGVVQDITQINLVRYELEQERNSLEDKVLLRTLELKKTIQELKDANVMLKDISQHKSQFLSSMSHEIRTPMNAILGTLGLIHDTPLNEEQNLLINTACHSANHLLNIINDILDFSKIEANKLELNKTVFDLRHLIHESVDMLNQHTQQKHNNIVVEIDNNLPLSLFSDRGRIKQIMVNLLNNANKFTHQGSITCKLSCLSLNHENNHESSQQISPKNVLLKIEVIDTGIGISESDQQNLFNVFSQIEQNHNRRFEGTGLGLAISKQLIDLLGGEIGVSSEVDKGSNFWVTLSIPISTSTVDNDKYSLVKSSTDELHKTLDNILVKDKLNHKELKTVESNPYRLLLVEDSEANIIVAKSILTKAGYEVEVALNGKLAIELIEQKKDNSFDIILMDLMMPEMDGAEATKIIRKMSSEVSALPILAMTANAYKGDKDYCLNVGMDDYISKPYTSTDLLNKISTMLVASNSNPISNNNKIAITEPETMHSNSQVFDDDILNLDIITELEADTSKELVPQMVVIFIRELNKRLLNIETAITEQNTEDIAIQAHALKSSSGTYGALHLQKTSIDLDLACKQNNEANIMLLSKKLVEAIIQTMSTYTKHFSIYG